MPQMSPINWLSLFIMFSITFLIINMMNYYMYNLNTPKFNLNFQFKLKKSLNWKW
nr:ATP synthase F0 subunit 8 [Bithia sp. 1 HNL-2023a]